jgi:DNA-binding NarL/FixJ family response regulator
LIEPARPEPRRGSIIEVEVRIDQPSLAARIGAMLDEDGGIAVVRSGSGRIPDLIITDTWSDALGRDPPVPVLMLSDGPDLAPALDWGAGQLSRGCSADQLRIAIDAALHGLAVLPSRWRSRSEAAGFDAQPAASDPPRPTALTAREQQVLELLAQGASNKTIARRLDISLHTAKFHVASILAKLGAAGRTEAVANAIRLGWLML